jgi:hypothetical protein
MRAVLTGLSARYKQISASITTTVQLTFRRKSGKQVANTLFIRTAKIGVSP